MSRYFTCHEEVCLVTHACMCIEQRCEIWLLDMKSDKKIWLLDMKSDKKIWLLDMKSDKKIWLLDMKSDKKDLVVRHEKW